MKRLILLSELSINLSKVIDSEIKKRIPANGAKLAYIPSASDRQRAYFYKMKDYYQSLGVHDFLYFDIDEEYKEELRMELLMCNVIHLSGGDPVHFLKNIIRNDIDKLLTQFVREGGLLIGVSAGAIIMGPNIRIIDLLREADEATMTGDGKALGLVDFTTFPHWSGDEALLAQVKDFAIKNKIKVYAYRDRDAIFIDGNNLAVLGDILVANER